MSARFEAPIEPTTLVVIPQPELLGARILALRKESVTEPAAAEFTATESRSFAMGLRRRALLDYGHSILKSRRAVPLRRTRSQEEVSAMVTEVMGQMDVGRTLRDAVSDVVAADADEPGMKVLEGVGALLIDANSLDPLEAHANLALVLQNFPIPLIGALAAAQASQEPWHLPATKADLWHKEGITGKGMTVGVLDTGIDPAHPEFAGKTLYFQEFDAQGKPVSGAARDSGYHGTHVSGLAAGKTVGIAPDAMLAVAAVLTLVNAKGENYGCLAQILAGLNWLLTSAARNQPPIYIINGSFGSTGYNNYLYGALQNAAVAPGSLLIGAIGNSGIYGINQHGSPGNYDIVIGVGATDQKDNVCPFSDWGTQNGVNKPDMSAPGDSIYSSLPGGKYGPLSGTSMATPMVAGAAALALQQDSSLVGNPAALEAKLRSLVRKLTGAQNVARGGLGTLDLTTL